MPEQDNSKKRKIIMGLGTGRCGTMSLAAILDAQFQYNISHEMYWRLPWIPIRNYLDMVMKCIVTQYPGVVIGDVGFYYLNYVEMILEWADTTKFVCLKRERDGVIDSNTRCGKSLGANHFTSTKSKHWDSSIDLNRVESRVYRTCFPKFDAPREEAIGMYWDEYYRRAEIWQNKYPDNFKIFDMNATLNTLEGQKAVLKFCGMERGFLLTDTRIYKAFTGEKMY